MKLFYRQFGSGKPVVVLHGLFGLSDNWVTFGRKLGEQYSVYIPDLRNHGHSPHSPHFNFSVLENDLLEMLEDWELDEIFLIGHSLGGKTAISFSLHHPEKVKKLVVVDISLRKSISFGHHQALLDAMLSVDFRSVRSRSEVDGQLMLKVHNAKLRQFLLKNVYWRDHQTLDWRLNLRAINEQLPAIFEGVNDTGVFDRPVLFIRGGMSDYIQNTDLAEIKLKFPGAVVATIANASHWVHADAPGEFYTLVYDFLNR